MDIRHSKRILLLGKRDAGALDVVKDLTGSAPVPDVNGSTAGLTHEWSAETAYYKAKVPIWVDELDDVQSWKTEFLKPEAKEVVDAVGAWVYCFPRQQDGEISAEVEGVMKAIQDVVDEHSYGSDVVMLAVAKPVGKLPESKAAANHEELEDACTQYGFEYVDYSATGTNEFGEKVGFERLKEALEANEWDEGGDDEVDLDDLDFTADDFGDFGTEEAEMTAELFGMKAALNADGELDPPDGEGFSSAAQAVQVDDLDQLMSKLLAVKEQSAGLPEEERKKKAARAVREIMEGSSNLG